MPKDPMKSGTRRLRAELVANEELAVQRVLLAIEKHGGRLAEVAEELRVGKRTLSSMLAEHEELGQAARDARARKGGGA